MECVYLDNAATTCLSSEVRTAMGPFEAAEFGNPSSRHALGVRAAEALDRARARLRRVVGGPRRRVVFTSGGTEANNLAVLGAARARAHRGRHVLLGPFEHASVREAAAALGREGFEIERLPWSGAGSGTGCGTDGGGGIDLDRAASSLRPDTVLVACMLVSNEFGTILPAAGLARLARALSPRAFVHVDAVQALGKLELCIEDLDADSLALSAHKVRGPKGAGALILAEEIALEPLIHGGGQEGGLRAGTENVAGAVGLAEAAERADAGRASALAAAEAARAVLVGTLRRFDAAIIEDPERVPSILAAVVPGPAAEVWLHHLEQRGVLAGAGSACQARKRSLSPGFAARGLDDEQARHVLRFSFGASTGVEDARRAAAALAEVAALLLSGADRSVATRPRGEVGA